MRSFGLDVRSVIFGWCWFLFFLGFFTALARDSWLFGLFGVVDVVVFPLVVIMLSGLCESED